MKLGKQAHQMLAYQKSAPEFANSIENWRCSWIFLRNMAVKDYYTLVKHKIFISQNEKELLLNFCRQTQDLSESIKGFDLG